jgi:hypothetical protein
LEKLGRSKQRAGTGTMSQHAELAASILASVVMLALLVVLSAPVSYARPPENTNLIFGLWFEQLHQPGTGLPCCNISDCRQTESRIVGSHYEALVEGKWIAVPPETVVDQSDNPTGHAVVCWLPWSGILCFVRAPES